MTFGSLLATAMTAILVPVVVAILTAVATTIVTRTSEATDRRRDRYAEAMAALVAWIEFPYRVRRRTSDDPSTLEALANLGHDLQERLARSQAWIAAEHAQLAGTYSRARDRISARVGAALNDAWQSAPVTQASAMNLGDWGPAPHCQGDLLELQRAVESRFSRKRRSNDV